MRGNPKWYQSRTRRRGLAQQPKAGRQAGKAGTTTRSDHGYSMSGAPLNPRRQSTNHHQRRRSSRSHLGKLGAGAPGTKRKTRNGRGTENGGAGSLDSLQILAGGDVVAKPDHSATTADTHGDVMPDADPGGGCLSHELRGVLRGLRTIVDLLHRRFSRERAHAGTSETRQCTTTPAAAAILSCSTTCSERGRPTAMSGTLIRRCEHRAFLRPAGRKTVLASSNDDGGGTSGNAPGRSYRARCALS